MLELISSRVAAIQTWLRSNDLDAFIVPHEDEYLGEYIPAHNERLHWLTGFTGSAGAAVITKDRAAIFVDGRYTVQVQKQVSSELFEYCHLIETPPLEWIAKTVEAGARIGFDPRMHRSNWYTNAVEQYQTHFTLNAVEQNPVDLLWSDRPQAELTMVTLLSEDYTGESSESKRRKLAKTLVESNIDAAVITELDSICWLFNIRGLDVSRLPVLLSHAILNADGTAQLFIDPDRIEDKVAFDHHVGSGVTVLSPNSLESSIASLTGKSVSLDPSTSNAWFKLTLEQSLVNISEKADPCLMPKACKNSVEIDGMKHSHRRDGAAMVKFLSWLDSEVAAGRLHDEAIVADQLEQFRRQDPSLVDLSFDTISAAGGNAAMCHYNHLNQEQPGQLSQDTLYLVDSGGQYPDGTTDITRTIAIGNTSDEMKRQFTLVLKGHIGLASALFPKGTCGHQLDILARQHLWSHGFDYDHGTGHGVGHFLSVHEGPQRIGKVVNNVALAPGMVLSNEPGYYRADAFGIRIENLELVVEKPTNGDLTMLGFEPLTRCPIDVRNIDVSLLTDKEIAWLNNYHQIVEQEISPLIEDNVRAWLKAACAPIVR